MAHPKLASVRLRYNSACGYCGVRDIDCAGELTVDHFLPRSGGGGDEDENLVYSCFRCNQYKSDFIPSAQDIGSGRRILDPRVDNPNDHYKLNPEDGFLVPISETGRFRMELLRLNRPALVQYRLNRLMAEKTLEQIKKLNVLLDKKNRLIKLLKDVLGIQ